MCGLGGAAYRCSPPISASSRTIFTIQNEKDTKSTAFRARTHLRKFVGPRVTTDRTLRFHNMRCSWPAEERAAAERHDRRLAYASSLPQLKVPMSLKRAQTQMTYLEPIEPPDRRFKERILESELQHLKLVEVQAKHKQDQAMVRAAWHKEQVEQRRQEEVDLERRPANHSQVPRPPRLGPSLYGGAGLIAKSVNG